MIRILKLFALAIWLVLCLMLGWTVRRLGRRDWRDQLSCLCHSGTLWIVGVKLAVEGQVDTARPLLLVTNHLSYLDVILLGSVFPFRFTPKSEVAEWPFIRALARESDVIFIERKPEKVRRSIEAIQTALADGEVVCLFPEATTGNGQKLLPFKSSMFRLAEGGGMAGLSVQPAVISYLRIRKLPIDRTQWPFLAWYGDMQLFPHLWHLMGLGRIDVRVTFLPPVQLHEGEDRKQFALHCEGLVRQAMEDARLRDQITTRKTSWKGRLKIWRK